MTRIGLLLAALIVSLTARAQVRSISDLLATAGSDPGVTQFQSLLGTASGLRMHDPLVRQVALRIGFNGNSMGDSTGRTRRLDGLVSPRSCSLRITPISERSVFSSCVSVSGDIDSIVADGGSNPR